MQSSCSLPCAKEGEGSMTKDGMLPKGAPLRLLLPVIACLVAATGCRASDNESMRPLPYEGARLTMAGVDDGSGGLRVTTSEHFTRLAGGKLQTYAAAEPRSQSFATFADAAWQWEQKASPQFIAVGEAWVRTHGFPASWAKQLQRLGVRQGRKPLLAVVEGSAERWVRSPGGAEGGMALLGQSGWALDTLGAYDSRYGDDLVLPYLPAEALSRSGEGSRKTTPQALLFKNQKLVTVLSAGQSELLSCLRGSDLPRLVWPGTDQAESAAGRSTTLRQVSCRADIAANGDLKQPKLRVVLTVSALSDGRSTAGQWKERLKQQGAELIRSLQELRTDPLRLGEAVRKQYSGLWTQERWREALSRAEIKLDVDVNLHGGT